jgi:hypothetical protein
MLLSAVAPAIPCLALDTRVFAVSARRDRCEPRSSRHRCSTSDPTQGQSWVAYYAPVHERDELVRVALASRAERVVIPDARGVGYTRPGSLILLMACLRVGDPLSQALAAHSAHQRKRQTQALRLHSLTIMRHSRVCCDLIPGSEAAGAGAFGGHQADARPGDRCYRQLRLAHSSHGRKIEKPVEYRSGGVPLSIVSEEHWQRFVQTN